MNKETIKLILFFSIIWSLLMLWGYAILSAQYGWNNNVEVIGIDCEIYEDPIGTQPLTKLNWGFVGRGETVTKTIYIINTGNTEYQLFLFDQTWDPSITEIYIDVDWNINSNTWHMNGTYIPAEISLTIAETLPMTVSRFSFKLIVQAYTP